MSWQSLVTKQLIKYNRQKSINLLEKITKNMFKMFRDEQTTTTQLIKKFTSLKKKLDQCWDTALYSEYHRATKQYVDSLSSTIEAWCHIEEMRQPHMTRLNRLQKIKNASSYKKEKHTKSFGFSD